MNLVVTQEDQGDRQTDTMKIQWTGIQRTYRPQSNILLSSRHKNLVVLKKTSEL